MKKQAWLGGAALFAFLSTAAHAQEAPTSTSDDSADIVVTAQKRVERLSDVPIPVTVLNSDTLLNQNIVRIQDYASRIPGFAVTPAAQAVTVLSIRGVTTGVGANPTVGIMVDDVPFGSATAQGGGGVIPDFDPGDLQRIEVLRGPQGTLYGASSMGGLIKFVTTDPSFSGVSGNVRADLLGIRNGDGVGYGLRGFVNLPVSDTMALRVSGFGRRTPGYVDDPVRGVEGVNEEHVYGGRASLLWKLSDDVSLKLSALYQRNKRDGSADVDVALGDLQQSRVPDTGNYDRRVQAYSATLRANVGNSEIVSVTGYNRNQVVNSLDGGFAYGGLTFPIYGVRDAELIDAVDVKKFSQEVRVTTPLSENIDWLIGGFFTSEETAATSEIYALQRATGDRVGIFRGSNFPSTYREYAGFTDVTLRFSERFNVQLGARLSELRRTFTQRQYGPGASATGNIPLLEMNESAFTYLVSPQFKITPDIMIYARAASGFRPGGPNADAGPGTATAYKSDSTDNYEVGIKGSVLDRKLNFDLSVYHIDWKDIQLLVLNPATVRSYLINGSEARSQGVEFSLDVRPTTGLTLAGWIAYNDAELTKDFPATATVRGFKGDRLPNSSRFSANASIDQEFPLGETVTGSVGGTLSYVGSRQGVFTFNNVRQTFPGYAQLDLRAGLRTGPVDVNLFVNNVTDKRAAIYGGIGSFPSTAFTYIQPRTIGLSVGMNF